MDFNYLQKLKDTNEKYIDERMFKIVIFDVLYWNGEKTIEEGLTSRKKYLETLVSKEDSILEVIPTEFVKFNEDSKTNLEELFRKAKSRNNEGLMIKEAHDGSVYMPGKRKYWYKLKSIDIQSVETLDLILLAAYKGEVN